MPNLSHHPSYLPQNSTPPPFLLDEAQFWDLHPDLGQLQPESVAALFEARALLERTLRNRELLEEHDLLPDAEGIDALIRGHSTRVTVLTLRAHDYLRDVGTKQVADTQRLAMIAMFHDIGKLNPEIHPIVMSNNKLPRKSHSRISAANKNKWDIIKRHPKIGGRLVMALDSIEIMERSRIATGVEYHHERYDNDPKRTYYGIVRSEIPNESAIVTVVDTYDAMTSNRTYQEASRPNDALGEILKERGRQFFPFTVDALLALAPETNGFFKYFRAA